MPLTNLTTEQIAEREQLFMGGVPIDGRSVGNKQLRETILGWEQDVYFAIKHRLLDQGLIANGKGRGGSVLRVQDPLDVEVHLDELPTGPDDAPDEAELDPYPDEESLYAPMMATIERTWIRSQPFEQHLVEQTARGGARKDGKWSRPDVTVAAVTTYTYVPGRHLEVVSFEIKHHSGFDVTAVYEALAHGRAATRSYVLAYIPDELIEGFDNGVMSDVIDEANRHGIGLIIASDPEDFDSWDIREESTSIIPDPSKLNFFLARQLSQLSKEKLVRWFR